MKRDDMKIGDWVAQAHNGEILSSAQIGKVKDAYYYDGASLIDVVIYDFAGKRIGRTSPPEGGPRNFEPACEASDWVVIEEPKFPIRGVGLGYAAESLVKK